MLTKALEKELHVWQKNRLTRQRLPICKRPSENVIIVDKKPLINFSHNDYLCLSTHRDVKKKLIQGAEKYGLGSGASALVSGYYSPHQILEEKFAEFLQRDKAVLFSSGYLANVGLLSSLAHRDHVILSDKLCHASLLDGIRLSRAKHLRYRHHDVQHAALLLNRFKKMPSFLVTESIFSMEGDICPVSELASLAKQHQTTLIVDDAHAIGVLGKQGRGICEHDALSQEDVPCLITPFGKALGSMGAVISGKTTFMDAVVQFSNTYRYTTALPPAIAYATLESLKIMQNESWRRETLNELIQFFVQEAGSRRLKIASADLTPIKSILIGNNVLALKIKDHLQQAGFFISCIRPPAVPLHTTRLRISLNCLHQKQDIIFLLDTIADFNEKFF